MEENKFLEAVKLKEEIKCLENIIKDSQRDNARFCVSWPELVTETRLSEANTTIYTNNRLISYTKNNINILPKNIEDAIIKMINDEIENLKEKFNNL